jgi:flagellar biosynthesis protein FlhG
VSESASNPGAAPRALDPPETSAVPPAVWVIASGKGGVGKSTLAVLLAVESAARGIPTLLFDGVQNEGNLHVLLGRSPARRLAEVWHGEVSPVELLIEVREHLWLLPAPPQESLPDHLPPLERARLHHRLTETFDAFGAVFVDAGPGRSGALRAAALRATGLAVVATPEPASLSDAYAMLKIARLQSPHLEEGLIVNRAEDPAEAVEVHARLDLASRRFMGRPLRLLGAVPETAVLHRATRSAGALLSIEDAEVLRAVRGLASVLRSSTGARAAA